MIHAAEWRWRQLGGVLIFGVLDETPAREKKTSLTVQEFFLIHLQNRCQFIGCRVSRLHVLFVICPLAQNQPELWQQTFCLVADPQIPNVEKYLPSTLLQLELLSEAFTAHKVKMYK